jgi:hypothetical protein
MVGSNVSKEANMEVVFYVGMILWGLYLVVTEPIEKIEKDFGIKRDQ